MRTDIRTRVSINKGVDIREHRDRTNVSIHVWESEDATLIAEADIKISRIEFLDLVSPILAEMGLSVTPREVAN